MVNKPVEIRSLRVKDEAGQIRRLRVCTVWNTGAQKFTRVPAYARIAKPQKGYLGVQITGKNLGYVKVGKNFLVGNYLTVPFNFLSKTACRKLLKGTYISLEEVDGILVGVSSDPVGFTP